MDAAGKRLEDDDPFEPVFVALPAIDGTDPMTTMGRVFVEEFAGMGWSPALILRLFKDPFYQGPHMIYRARGEAAVQVLIDGVFGPPKEGASDA